ncbi:hypothetical protein B296_00044206 [Ensete ventricosum]|uniref:TFIIS N-terminal domain-containing protein n=1 Tax=Ensete ventricosum TaxID=4639 RepID=A0A426YKM9_ENSVE|nr:hypothetical protein B296_00044206 [Ensete ventricosum]
MRDGLSNIARVEELLSMIQKLNDCGTTNLGDPVTQWCTVASVLTVTDHKECLNQFLELNGLSYLNKWLQEALNLNADVNVIDAEELLCSLLTSFERLPIDYKRIISSGVGVTIELLLDHKSIPIKEKARILYDKWNHARNADISCHDHDICGASQSNQPRSSEDVHKSENCLNLVNPVVNISPCSMGTSEGNNRAESPGAELQVSNATRCSDSSAIDSTNKEMSPTPHQVFPMSLNAINSSAVLAVANSAGSSPVSNYLENLSVMGESPGCVAMGKPSTETCSQLGQEGDAADQHDTPLSKDAPDIEKEIGADMREDKLCKSNQGETSINSSSFAFSASMTPSVAAAELTISCKLDSDNGTTSAAKATEHQPKAGDFDYRREKCLITAKESNSAAIFTSGFQDYSCTASILDNVGDSQLSCQREEATSSAVKDIDRAINFKNRKGPFSTSTDFFKVVGTKAGEDISRKSEIGLGCLDDALEVARQVALAVEREVVDYREHFCSSPEVNSGEMTGFHSPGSEEEQLQAVTEEVGGDSSSAGKDHSGTSSPDKESEVTQHMSSDPGNSDKDKESPIPAQESVDKSVMDGCTFDLNADTCGDEPELKPSMKVSIAVSSPIAVFASPKGTPGVPVTPLHFEGEMGWKGSAATSAFRPASPRRTPDGKGTSSGQKKKSEFLGIDLNVAEREDDEFTCVRELPISSSLPSRDSCAEVVRSRPEKLYLDLNCLGDEDASTCPLSSQKLHLLNGEHSLSSASSSSYRHLSVGDFDLNDNPCFPDIGVTHNLDKASTKALESYGGPAPYDPVIKLMGSVIAVERKHNPNQAQQHSFLPNGLNNIRPTIVSPPLFVNMLNPSCGYAGLPTGRMISAPAAYYSPGSISYVVDSRGAAAIPHVAGAGGLGVVPSARPPFLLGATTNMPSDMAGFGMSQLHVDLNSGMPSTEGGGFEQLFLQGYRSRMEDQTRSSAQQPSSSAVGLKRKEPDTAGWEPSLYGYKQMAPR